MLHPIWDNWVDASKAVNLLGRKFSLWAIIPQRWAPWLWPIKCKLLILKLYFDIPKTVHNPSTTLSATSGTKVAGLLAFVGRKSENVDFLLQSIPNILQLLSAFSNAWANHLVFPFLSSFQPCEMMKFFDAE